jgi:hypothetical protein
VKFRRAQLAFALLLAACGSKSEASDPLPGKTQSELRCEAGAARACPCLGGGQGTQTCAISGRAFGPCTACPPSADASRAQDVGGSDASGASGAMSAGVGGRGASGNAGSGSAGTGGFAGGGFAGGGSAGAGNAGAAIDSGAAGSETREPGSPDPLPAAKGIACGVGLPVLCDVASEKCCKRSLSVDTCIPVAMACECEQDNCETLEARCDGPEDCAQGQLCCAGGTGRAAYTGFTCAASCSSTSRQACHAAGDCPAQLTCAISQILASVSVCTDPRSLEQ